MYHFSLCLCIRVRLANQENLVSVGLLDLRYVTHLLAIDLRIIMYHSNV